jgi:hypothetical protein
MSSDGAAYVGVSLYNRRLYPTGCAKAYTYGTAKLSKDGVLLQSFQIGDYE